MKNKTKITFNSRFIKKTHHYSKFIILLSFLLIAFTVGDSRSEYLIPAYGRSLISADLDLDGDIDIVSGHNYFWQTEWSGLTFLMNNDSGYYNLVDTLFIYGGQTAISVANIKGDEYPEIVGQYYDGLQSNAAIVEINNGNYDITYYPMCNNLTSFNIGDVSGNNAIDIVFMSNNDFLWGIIYNDGTGNFSEPEYFDLGYPPIDIACADLNDDGRSDVIVAGSYIEVYFSTETGFEQSTLGFLLPWSLGGHTLLISDFDNDNDVIFYATHNSNYGAVYMYENLGHNEFYEHDYFYFTPFCSYAQIADFNNDSLPDMVFIESFGEGLQLFINQGNFQLGDQQFIPVESPSLKGLNCNDFDNNGYNDIAIIQSALPQSTLKLLFNDGHGNFVEDPVSILEKEETKKRFLSCYPNPFSDYINIEVSVNEKNSIDLSVYDINGKKIKTITNKIYSPGKYKFKWNGTCKNGKEVNGGAYLIRLKTGSHIQTERVIKMK